MAQTAVEWLVEQITNKVGYYSEEVQQEIYQQAKEMEKQQAERMYSEEEVLQLLLRLQQTESYDNLYEWFEQFKKK